MKTNRKVNFFKGCASGLLAISILCACQKTVQKGNPEGNFVLSDRDWRIKSIVMNPVLLDVNGDGKEDKEVISSLQKKDRNKHLIFDTSGKVFEKYNPADIQDHGEAVVENGTWNTNASGDSLIWIQKSGAPFRAKMNVLSDNQVQLTYKQLGIEVVYLFEHE